jgi:hypothetical protein
MDDLDSIKKKIAGLIAKAEATDNINEAMAFMAKANEWLERYQLERHELHVDDPMGHTPRDCSPSDAWVFKVIGAAARYWGADVVWEENRRHEVNGRKAYRVFGPESARTTHELMTDYLLAQVRVQGRIYANEHRCTPSVGTRNVGLAFANRLNELARANKIRRDVLASKALVPVDVNKQMIDAFYGNLKKLAKVRTGFTTSARDYADRINLNSQVGGSRQRVIGSK